MRYNIDLVNKQAEVTESPRIEIKGKMSDPFLAYKIAIHGDSNYDELRKILMSNPFLYEGTNESIKIKILDEFCFMNGREILSLGGLIVAKNIKKREKRALVKKCLNTWENEYQAELNEKINQIDNQLDIADRTKPKYIKLITISIIALIMMVLFLISFPTTKALEIKNIGTILAKVQTKNETTKVCNFMRYLSLVLTCLTFLYAVIYDITTKIFYNNYNKIFNRITNLTRTVKNVSKKYFKKIRKHYFKRINKHQDSDYKPYYIEDIMKKKYRLSNIQSVTNRNLKKLASIKKSIKKTYQLKWSLYGVAILSIISYIVLLFVF